MRITIPRTAVVRNGQGFALLVRHPDRLRSGPLFRTGQIIEEAQLWPTPDFPLVPLVIEYAGTTKTDDAGRPVRGHNRGRDIHILWQYDGKERVWVKLCETEVGGSEWERIFRPLIAEVVELPEINEEERGCDLANQALAAALEILVNAPTDKTHLIAIGRYHDISTAAVVEQTGRLSDRARLAAAADAVATLRRMPERVTVSAEPPRSLRKSAEEAPVIDWDELRRLLKKPVGRALEPGGSGRPPSADVPATLRKPPGRAKTVAKRKHYRRSRDVSTEWVIEMRRADLSLREIAERTGLHHSTVRRLLLKSQADAADAPATRSALSRRGLYGNLPKRLRSSIGAAGDQAPGGSDATAVDAPATLRKPPGRATKPAARAKAAKA